MFENKLIREVHVSRYIASWINSGGDLSRNTGGRFDFADWLESLGLDKDEIRYICNYADNGRLELQESAKAFIRALNNK